jgi:hypothetical protein
MLRLCLHPPVVKVLIIIPTLMSLGDVSQRNERKP